MAKAKKKTLIDYPWSEEDNLRLYHFEGIGAKKKLLTGEHDGESKEENELRAIRHGEGHQSREA